MFKEIISLVFPQVCLSCSAPIVNSPSSICLKCRTALPYTGFHQKASNPVLNLLWGKVEVEHASAMFYFKHGNRIQKLMHQLKYKGVQEIGKELGKMMGRRYLKSETYAATDVVIPVPLHPQKKRLRGYNQCESIAMGIAEVLESEVCTDAVKRMRANATQTKKGHFDRYENVKNLFAVQKPELIEGRRVLLVDDVITTGSTMASCAKTIKEETNCKLIVSTAAIAI